MANRKIVITVLIAALLAFILISGWYSLYVRYRVLHETLAAMQEEQHTADAEQQAFSEIVKINQRLLFHNLNEGREALHMPSVEMIDQGAPGGEEIPHDIETGNTEYPLDLFYDGVRYFADFYRSRDVEYRMKEAVEQESIRQYLRSKGYILRRSGRSEYRVEGGQFTRAALYITGAREGDAPVLKIFGSAGDEETIFLAEHDELTDNTMAEKILRVVQGRIEKLEGSLEKFTERSEICDRLIKKLIRDSDDLEEKLLFEQPSSIETPSDYVCTLRPVRRSDGLPVGVRFADGAFFIGNDHFADEEDFSSSLYAAVAALDLRSEEEVRVDGISELLQELAADSSFQSFLQDQGLRMGQIPRDEGDYLYFDLFDADDKHYGAFSVLKKVGKIYLTDPDDIILTSLMTIDIGPDFEHSDNTGGSVADFDSLPEPSEFSKAAQSSGATLLLCGTHEKNADTIIVASMVKGEQVRLISVPRDLYYHHLKLSTHYRRYGIERLKTIIEDMMGIEFDGYISVDMYAFIDIIDVLDGIDISLEVPLRDPTYRIREQGEWTTLDYPAGLHHLSGVEALRIVRSRHTSDDFERGYRQQLVIRGLMDRMNELHSDKLREVYDIINILYRYVDSDLNAYELIQYFLEYHNAEIVPRKSISTDNILYTTYSNFYLSGLTPEDVDDDFYKGAWILLPLNDDWDLIRRYTFQQLYE